MSKQLELSILFALLTHCPTKIHESVSFFPDTETHKNKFQETP